MPSCECLDFRRNGLPCKHFFSVFKHFPEWQWESLPENYRNNPFLSLDEESPFSCPTNENPISHHDNLPQMEEPRDRQRPDTPRDNKLNTERKLRQNQMACRSILKELTTLTYNVCDPSALDDLKTGLKPILSKFEGHQLKDEQENISASTKKIGIVNNVEVNKETSLQNDKHNKPVGEHASIMRKNYQIELPVDDDFQPKKKKTQRKSNLSTKGISTLSTAGELRSSSSHLLERQSLTVRNTKENIFESKSPDFITTSNDIITEIRSSSSTVDENVMDVETGFLLDRPRDEVPCAAITDLKETDIPQSTATTFTSTETAYIIIDENSLDPLVWIKIKNNNICTANAENELLLYQQTKTRLLEKHTWLNNVEIQHSSFSY